MTGKTNLDSLKSRGYRFGECSKCKRDDVLLHRGSSGEETERLTFHDDQDGVQCPGGGSTPVRAVP